MNDLKQARNKGGFCWQKAHTDGITTGGHLAKLLEHQNTDALREMYSYEKYIRREKDTKPISEGHIFVRSFKVKWGRRASVLFCGIHLCDVIFLKNQKNAPPPPDKLVSYLATTFTLQAPHPYD